MAESRHTAAHHQHPQSTSPTSTSTATSIPSWEPSLDELECMDRLSIMVFQEDSPHYRTYDYLTDVLLDAQNSPQSSDNRNTNSRPIDAECRTRMVEWCYQIVDYASLQRDTVAIAMSYLDRYLSSSSKKSSPGDTDSTTTRNYNYNARDAILQRKQYQLACITSLYMAIKVHEPQPLMPSSSSNENVLPLTMHKFSELSRRVYSVEEMQSMEQDILNSLDWRLNGPTSFTILYTLFQIFLGQERKQEQHEEQKQGNNLEESQQRQDGQSPIYSKMKRLATIQLEYALGDYAFVSCKQSDLAVAAILNSMEPFVQSTHNTDEQVEEEQQQSMPLLSAHDRIQIINRILHPTNAQIHSVEFREMKDRLWDMGLKGNTSTTCSSSGGGGENVLRVTVGEQYYTFFRNRHTPSQAGISTSINGDVSRRSSSSSSTSTRDSSPVCVSRNERRDIAEAGACSEEERKVPSSSTSSSCSNSSHSLSSTTTTNSNKQSDRSSNGSSSNNTKSIQTNGSCSSSGNAVTMGQEPSI